MLKKENIIREDLSREGFDRLALEVFRFQLQHNDLYRRWIRFLKIEPEKVDTPEKIPFLPIEFFKHHQVVSSPVTANTRVFTSSSTTSQTPASHYVNDISAYNRSFAKGFEFFYGSPRDYCVLALLPNYLQRGGSSLVHMCDALIRESGHPDSGFFLDNLDELLVRIERLKKAGTKVLLIGVSYALMDLCEKNVKLSSNFTVMETGGMKGRREEMIKSELHSYLMKGFGINSVHSEYGMTELLSQAYSRGGGFFETPPWMRFYIREVNDPLILRKDLKTGGINVIDLANFNSCSFIATKDLGRLNTNGQLELMGRYDHSDVRGCNLMMSDF